MIRHIVAWKFKEYVGGASAMENAMELKKQLEALGRGNLDRKSTRQNSSHIRRSRMPSSA